jgi:succinyl-CoA synthetase alpha subunit
MLAYGVKVVAGVTPGKGGQNVHDVPVFDTIADAKRQFRVDASMILVPPAGVRSAALEAIENRIPLIVAITEFVPTHDTLVIRRVAQKENVRLIGPNTIGIISPGKSQIGLMPGFIYSEGSIGIVSRSGTLIHEIASNLTYKGFGQSTCVGIGGDAVRGAGFVDMLTLFRDDDQTETIILIGEIGGAEEESAAEFIKETRYPKKIVAFIAGATAPHEKRMGHAGAIISKGLATAESKLRSLESSGATIARSLDEILELAKA